MNRKFLKNMAMDVSSNSCQNNHFRINKKLRVLYPLLILLIISALSFSCRTFLGSQNSLSKSEVAEGWILMFDGKTTDGWRGYNREGFPATGWIIEDGTLACISGRLDRSERGGDIIFDQKFLNFHLKLDWKIEEVGNSGIFYLAREIPRTAIWQTAPEFQLLDNERNPDALRGVNNNRKSASLYDILPAVPQNANPAGKWNSAEIIVNNGYVTHRQNGVDVVKFQIGTPEWDAMVDKSKFNVELFGKFLEGYIGLQDHGNDIWFKNIKIRSL